MYPVIVTGVGSSGTSMIAGIVHKLGIKMGDRWQTTPPRHGKPWDRYEDSELCELFVMAKKESITTIEFVNHLKALKRKGKWGFKHPAISETIPFFERAFPRARWIWAKRETGSNVESLISHWGNKGRDRSGWWELYTIRMAKLTRFMPKDAYIAQYEDFLENPRKEVKRLAKWLKVPVTKEAINFVQAPSG